MYLMKKEIPSGLSRYLYEIHSARLFAQTLQLPLGGKSFLLGRNSYRVTAATNSFISAIYSLVGKLQ
jgi:hypothetical protein